MLVGQNVTACTRYRQTIRQRANFYRLGLILNMLQVLQVPFETRKDCASSVGVVLLCYRSSVFFLSFSSLHSRRMYLSYTE